MKRPRPLTHVELIQWEFVDKAFRKNRIWRNNYISGREYRPVSIAPGLKGLEITCILVDEL